MGPTSQPVLSRYTAVFDAPIKPGAPDKYPRASQINPGYLSHFTGESIASRADLEGRHTPKGLRSRPASQTSGYAKLGHANLVFSPFYVVTLLK